MQSFEQADNTQLLSRLAGKPVAESLMQRYGGLTNLAQASFDELQQVKGIGQSKAAAIKSAFLLAQRLTQETHRESPVLDNPGRIADVLREPNRLYAVEHFQVLCLNTRRRLIAVENIGQGILDQVLVHAREVFAVAIAKRASAIVLAHNHPGGDPTPSEADNLPSEEKNGCSPWVANRTKNPPWRRYCRLARPRLRRRHRVHFETAMP